MDFFRNRYHRINRTLLTLIGQWPYQSPKWQRLQQIFYHLNIISVMIVQGIKMFEARGDVDIMVECLTPMGVQAAACAKSINCIVHRHKMKDLLDRMKKDWSSLTNEQEIKILERYAERGNKLCFTYASVCFFVQLSNCFDYYFYIVIVIEIVYIVFLFGSLVVYLLIPVMPQLLDIVLPLNESRQRVYLYQTEYYIDAESHYYAILLHTYSGTVMTICTVVATDTIFAAYIQHICGKLAIISYRLERIAVNDSLKFDVKPAIEDDVKYQEFIECIKIHQDAIEFAVIIEASYTQLFLFQLGLSVLLISVSLLQLLTKFGQYGEMYRLIQFISAQMVHLFFMSWPGQKLINQTVNFRDSIYAAGWYTLSMRTRSLLKIVMLSGACPPKITACKHYDVSMENFARVVQTSISYFTVLASLR